MIGLLLAFALGATSGPKLAAPGLTGANVEKASLDFFSEHLAQQLTLEGVRVITAGELRTLLGMERQAQLLGCTEDAATCAAEISGALDTDGVLTGSIGKFEDGYRVNLKILRTGGKNPLVWSGQAATSAQLIEELTTAARGFARQLGVSPGAWWAPGVAGVVLLAAGGAFGFVAMSDAGRLRGPSDGVSALAIADAAATFREGRAFEIASYVALGVGLVCVLASVVWWISGGLP